MCYYTNTMGSLHQDIETSTAEGNIYRIDISLNVQKICFTIHSIKLTENCEVYFHKIHCIDFPFFSVNIFVENHILIFMQMRESNRLPSYSNLVKFYFYTFKNSLSMNDSVLYILRIYKITDNDKIVYDDVHFFITSS